MLPAIDSGEDACGIGGPDEGLWIIVVLFDVAVDGGLQIDDGMKDAAFQSPLGECGEEGLDGVEPRGRCRREVKGPARMAAEPGFDLGMFAVGGSLAYSLDHELVGGSFSAAPGDVGLPWLRGGISGVGTYTAILDKNFCR